MDVRHAVGAVIPGAQGRILAALVEVSTELTIRSIARLAGVSPAQASRVLSGLAELGIVERRDIPPAVVFRLVPENVATRAIMALARARDTVLVELGKTASQLTPAPASVVVFGSFARGDADRDSDLDVLVIRPASVSEDDDAWAASVESWRQGAVRLAGNAVEVVEVGESEAGPLLRSGRAVWKDIRREGIVVAGRSLTDLAAS